MKLRLIAIFAVSLSATAFSDEVRTPDEAKAFVLKAEADLAALSAYVNRSAWVRATYITEDTEWLESKAVAESTQLAVRFASEASAFDATPADPVTRRKLDLLKRSLVLPAPQKPQDALELAAISSRLSSLYGTGQFSYRGRSIDLPEAEDIMAKSRDPADLEAIWEGWHSISRPMRADYARLVDLANEGARQLGYADTGALWRSNYDMDPDAFAGEIDRIWTELEPFYTSLHCYVRARLNEKYGDAVQHRTGTIRADLLGNMWAQEWSNIYEVVAPKEPAAGSSYDLESLLVAKGYDPRRMVETAETFYSSLGFAKLPATFWQRSMLVKPKDRQVECHASAWDLDDRDDLRIKMCIKVTGEDFVTIHHELGHNYYQRAYASQPYIFLGSANDGFHEAVGDFIALSATTPTYLKQIGILDTVPDAAGDIPLLLKTALDKIAFLPFGVLVDKWRWEVFSGATGPEAYNTRWWQLREMYQGLSPPRERPADAFDPGAKYHVAGNTPYARYLLALVYQFQFHRSACRQAGIAGPLHRCSIYGNDAVGARFGSMMKLGLSKPWPEALAEFTGERQIDASAVTDYFAPLRTWLAERTAGEKCGW